MIRYNCHSHVYNAKYAPVNVMRILNLEYDSVAKTQNGHQI